MICRCFMIWVSDQSKIYKRASTGAAIGAMLLGMLTDYIGQRAPVVSVSLSSSLIGLFIYSGRQRIVNRHYQSHIPSSCSGTRREVATHRHDDHSRLSHRRSVHTYHLRHLHRSRPATSAQGKSTRHEHGKNSSTTILIGKKFRWRRSSMDPLQ